MLQAYDLWIFPRTSGLLAFFAALSAELIWTGQQAQPVAKSAELFDQEDNISAAVPQRIVPA